MNVTYNMHSNFCVGRSFSSKHFEKRNTTAYYPTLTMMWSWKAQKALFRGPLHPFPNVVLCP
jgi:hypothetical protein